MTEYNQYLNKIHTGDFKPCDSIDELNDFNKCRSMAYEYLTRRFDINEKESYHWFLVCIFVLPKAIFGNLTDYAILKGCSIRHMDGMERAYFSHQAIINNTIMFNYHPIDWLMYFVFQVDKNKYLNDPIRQVYRASDFR